MSTQDVDFIHAPFTSADSQSSDLANVSVIICLPPSSLSTVKQPLDFILQEGGIGQLQIFKLANCSYSFLQITWLHYCSLKRVISEIHWRENKAVH